MVNHLFLHLIAEFRDIVHKIYNLASVRPCPQPFRFHLITLAMQPCLKGFYFLRVFFIEGLNPRLLLRRQVQSGIGGHDCAVRDWLVIHHA